MCLFVVVVQVLVLGDNNTITNTTVEPDDFTSIPLTTAAGN